MNRTIGIGTFTFVGIDGAAWSTDARGAQISTDCGDEPARPSTQLWSRSGDTITMGLDCTIDLNAFPGLLARAHYAELHRQLREQAGGDEVLRLSVERVAASHITGEPQLSNCRAVWLKMAATFRLSGDLARARHCLGVARSLRGRAGLP